MGASHTTAVGGAPLEAVGGNFKMYTVYIIKSVSTGKYYIGYTDDIVDRVKHHNSGANKSTRPGRPWEIIYTEKLADKKSAWLREHQIKSYKGGDAFKKLINGRFA